MRRPSELLTGLRRAAVTPLVVTQNSAVDGAREAASPQRQATGGIRVQDLTRHPPADSEHCGCASDGRSLSAARKTRPKAHYWWLSVALAGIVLAESATSAAAVKVGCFVDSFKTELIADRVWCTRAQLELAVVEYIGWFNDCRLHQALGDLPPS
jgi:hypothetical protein